MTIRTYKVTMTVEKEMTVTIDSDKINEKFFEDFSSYMFHIESDEALCEHIGHCVMFNNDDFVEGLGPLVWHKPDIAGLGVAISRTDDIIEEFEVQVVKNDN